MPRRILTIFLALALAIGQNGALKADATAQTLPFAQNWSNIGLITTANDWSGVPGIIGYRGDDLTTLTGTDPQTILADGTLTPVNVIANQTSTALTTGAVAEFDGITNPVVALQGSGTADAPFVLLSLDTTGKTGSLVSYNLRDIDGTADNAIQPVALQYRVGNSGNFTNLPAGFVADATTGPSLATLVTPVSVTLPGAADNQPLVQLRIITTNAVGNDEWVGIDDISVVSTSAPTAPTGSGGAHPSSLLPGATTLLTVAVTPGANPASTGVGVTADLSAIGGSNPQLFYDDATHGDAASGDLTFSFQATVALATTPGTKSLPANISDAQFRGSTTNISLTVQPPPPTHRAISEIQGFGSTSPFAGQAVSTDGIVTGLKSNGFFLQTPDGLADGDPTTSEGIFVFTSSAPPAAAARGNSVQVIGTVQEFIPSVDMFSPPATELTNPAVTLLSTGHPLPAPVILTAADTDPAGTIEQLERLEGMRVQVGSLTVIAPTQGNVNEPSATASSTGVFYGVITGIARPFREPGIEMPDPLPTGAPPTIPRFDANPERLRVDSDGQTGGSTAIDVSTGSVVTGLVGPLDYSFRTYTILPDPAAPPVVSGGAAPTAISAPTSQQFTVGELNFERFFDTVNDPLTSDAVLTQTAFNNRLNKASLMIRNVLQSPDILGVEEMENLANLQAIAAKVNSDAVAGGGADPNYAAYLLEGNDIGGIDVGFLVKSSRVTVAGVTQEGKDTTYVNPNNGADELLNDRPPLILRATINNPLGPNVPLTVIANHLRSLSGVDDPVDGNRVRTKRRAQAEYLANLVQARQVADPTGHIILVGDFNAFEINDGYVDVMGTIRGVPAPADQVALASPDLVDPDLLDLEGILPPEQRYSYVFDGNAQLLDHVLITGNLASMVHGLQHSRNDADFPETARNDMGVADRISDHDGVVAYFALPETARTSTTISSSVNPSVVGQSVTFTAHVTSGQNPVPVRSVTFKEDGTAVGTVNLDNNGNALQSLSFFSAGDRAITAEYSGAPGFGPSSAQLMQSVLLPRLFINDVSVVEGNIGIAHAMFTASLSNPSSSTVTVDFATAPGTATSPSDYASTNGTLIFNPGETSRTITVDVNGDTDVEPNETFFVNLTNPTNASLGSATGTGTIQNDDVPTPAKPTVSVADASVVEGNVGTKPMAFALRLSAPANKRVTARYQIQPGTALPHEDYVKNNGSVVFEPGDTAKTVSVLVNGDIVVETNESFTVEIVDTNNNATIGRAVAVGTIVNDDGPATVPSFALGQFVLFGNAGVTVGDNTVVTSGNVGAALAKAGSNPNNDRKVEVVIGDSARVQGVGKTVGDTIRLRPGSAIFDAFFNNLLNLGGAISGTQFEGISLPVLTLPSLPAITPGAAGVDVKRNLPVTLIPGAYGDVVVRADAVLTLAPGLYQFNSLDVRAGARVQATGAVEVRVKGTTDFAASTYLGPSTPAGSARTVVLKVAGVWAGGVHANFGQASQVRANVLAPNGTIFLRQGVQATGAFVGDNVQTGANVRLTLDSGF